MIGHVLKMAKFSKTRTHIYNYINLSNDIESKKRLKDICNLKALFLSNLLTKDPFIQIQMVNYLEKHKMNHLINQDLYDIIILEDQFHSIYIQNQDKIPVHTINEKVNIILNDIKKEENLTIHRAFLEYLVMKKIQSFHLFCYCLCNPDLYFIQENISLIKPDINIENVKLYLSDDPLAQIQTMKKMNHFTLYVLYKYHLNKLESNEIKLGLPEKDLQKNLYRFFEIGNTKLNQETINNIQKNKIFPI